MGEKVKARQSAGKAGKHGTPKKGWKGSSFKFGKNDNVERRLKKIRRAFYVLYLAFFCGCTSYKGAKVTEGTDLSVGISLPTTGTTLDLSIMNYLSGFHMGIDRNCNLTLKYSCTEENSYFGVIETKKTRQIDSAVTPEPSSPTQPSASTADKDAQNNTPHAE